MRSLIALTALLFAACGAPEDVDLGTDTQALSPIALPGAVARCERGAGLSRDIAPIARRPIAKLELARRVRAPKAEAAPDFLPVRLLLRDVEVVDLGDELRVSASGDDPVTFGAEGFGAIIVSTPDGAQDIASFEPFGRCGSFWMSETAPYADELPSQVLVEWRMPGGHAVSQIVEVW